MFSDRQLRIVVIPVKKHSQRQEALLRQFMRNCGSNTISELKCIITDWIRNVRSIVDRWDISVLLDPEEPKIEAQTDMK